VIRRDLQILRRLAKEAHPFRFQILGVFVLGFLATPLALLTPVPLMVAVDSVLGDEPLPGFLAAIVPDAIEQSQNALLIFTAASFAGVALLAQVQVLGQTLLQTYTGEKLLLQFRSKLFQQSQRLSLMYHDRVGTADSAYRVIEDAKSLQYIAMESLVSILTALTTLAAMLYVTFRVDAQLALVTLSVVPFLVLLSTQFRHRLRARSREVKKLESSALSVVQEVLGGLRMVKAFSQEEREHERFYERASDGMVARVRLVLAQSAYSLAVGAVVGSGGALVLYIGVRRVQQGAITLGDLLLVMSYLTQLYQPIKTLAKRAGTLQSHLASAERAFALLDEAPEVAECPSPVRTGRAEGAVRFSAVSFAYEPRRLALQDISFDVPAGTAVGLMGHTGAGKTTLMNLLLRFYDPTTGHIELDGVDLRSYRLQDLRAQFGIVLQDPILFSSSVVENIAYARPEAKSREIEQAARAANAHDFISSLPDGYDTQVGDRGMRLSGGERQRISLARAFLRDAPILILDEPTSSVDTETEMLILDAMNRLIARRTSFMIAHRLSTLDACDLHIELAHGRLVEIASGGPAVAPRAAESRPYRYRTPADTVELVRLHAAHDSDQRIAAVLTKQGRRNGTGARFTEPRVRYPRNKHTIPATQPAGDGDFVSMAQAAVELGVAPTTIRRWLAAGLLPAQQTARHAPWRIHLTDEIRDRFVSDVPDGYVPLDTAAKALGVARQTVLHKVQCGELRAVQVTNGRRKGLRIQVSGESAGLSDQ
jgi:ATP-binding cassette, subfamily B, bacterial